MYHTDESHSKFISVLTTREKKKPKKSEKQIFYVKKIKK